MRKSVVIFPDSVPSAKVLIPLVLVFEPVVYCQPVEKDDSGGTLSKLCQAMVERSLCSLQSPAPLGENRERFLHLVRDIRERRDDYSAQLAHVSLASISTNSRPANETKSSILSSLLSAHGIESADNEQRKKLLWQARLIMKLAEQHDADQQKIAEDVHDLHEKEQRLFSGLSQENGSPFSLTGKLTSLVPDNDTTQHLRLKAWSRLFAFGSMSLAGSGLFVSADPDAVDRLGEEYEHGSGTRPEPFLTIQLPARYPDESRFLEQFHHFLQDETTIKASLPALLENPSNVSEEHLRMFTGKGSEWNTLVERYFPQQECGRCTLVLYAFPKVQIRQLFLDSFGHDEDALRADLADEVAQDIVIGLLAGQ